MEAEMERDNSGEVKLKELQVCRQTLVTSLKLIPKLKRSKREGSRKIQESEREPVIHTSEQTWVRSGNESARRRENRACTHLDKYTLTPLHNLSWRDC